LEFVLLLTHIYYALHFSHVLLVSTSCSSRDILMCFLFLLYCFLKNIIYIPHGLWVYIVVDTDMYPYALLIDYILTSFSRLCCQDRGW